MSDAEDRKEFARWQDHDSSDWTVSIGAHRGIEKAAPGERAPVGFGFEGSNGRRCGGGSVLRSMQGRRGEDRALLAIHTKVDGSGTKTLK